MATYKMESTGAPKKSSKDEKLEKAKKSFRMAMDADAEQRDREREDLRFQVPEYQWDEDARAQRRGGVVGNQVVPARPMLSISLLTQPLQLIQNQASQARLGVELHPVSEDANDELAEIKQGLYRRIERDSNANQARLWALDRAKQCGRGWYLVTTKYDEESENEFDQEIVIERILQQETVYIDPSATKADFSDARFGGMATWVPLESFKEQWPDADIPETDSEFLDWMHDEPEWVKTQDEEKAVLVLTHWYKEITYKKIQKGNLSRNIEVVNVRCCKLNAKEILEEVDWNGHWIPLIPVIGRELQLIDGERRWEGLVRQARDGQKLFNFAASNLVERMALEPKAPYIMAEGQAEGHESEWLQANTRNFPYLEYKPTTVAGAPVPPPMRSQIDSTGMSLALMALDQGKQFVQTATAVYEPSLGEMPKQRTAQSGRALIALQQQSDAGTSHFIQNLAGISMPYEAKVILDLIPTIYDRPGRVTQVLGGEDETEMVMLNRPYIEDQDGSPQGLNVPAGMPLPPQAKFYDLSKGKYSISVSVGKSYQTRLQEGQAEIGEVLQAQPNLMPIIGATYFRFRDFPGAKEIADILKKMRNKQFPELADDKPGSPEELEAKVQQMQGYIQEIEERLKQANRELDVEQAKQQATIQKAQIDAQAGAQKAQLDAQSTAQKAAMDAQTTSDKAELEAATKIKIANLEAEVKLAIEQMKQQFAAMQASLQRRHESESQAEGEGHDAAMAERGAEAEAERQETDLSFKASADLPLNQE